MEKWGILPLAVLSWAFVVLTQTSIDVKDIVVSECRIWGVFHLNLRGDYLLTLTQARSACNLFGTVLASKAQVIHAQKDGFETCRYGWVDDGFLVVPRIVSKEKCGKNRTGVMTWKVGTGNQSDGYCFRLTDGQKTNTCETLTVQTTTIMSPTETPLLDLSPTGMKPTTAVSFEPTPILDTETTHAPQETKSVFSTLIITNPRSFTSRESFTMSTAEEGLVLVNRWSTYCVLGVVVVVLLVLFVIAVICYTRRQKKNFSFSRNGQPKEAIEAEVWNHNLLEDGSS
ncbi:lymphatic vessel endothelial hyaluronic acid receptor 1-like [Heptranchias perlo]|uniref:lymphatic vessel endothelial hyaluronic acid receptor 1-like n=1 Tax=Heptranchias perlo TaxID=212740 RepID=UPI003559F135